tara:strand:+ start:115 stop:513 length:399 start_codon:yes stop_codon:yes gene_type:complete
MEDPTILDRHGNRRLHTPCVGSTVKLTLNMQAPKYKRDKYIECDLAVPWEVIGISAQYFSVRHPNHGSKDYKRPDGTIEPNERTIPLSRAGNSRFAGVHWAPAKIKGWVKPHELASKVGMTAPPGLPKSDYE